MAIRRLVSQSSVSGGVRPLPRSMLAGWTRGRGRGWQERRRNKKETRSTHASDGSEERKKAGKQSVGGREKEEGGRREGGELTIGCHECRESYARTGRGKPWRRGGAPVTIASNTIPSRGKFSEWSCRKWKSFKGESQFHNNSDRLPRGTILWHLHLPRRGIRWGRKRVCFV